MVSSIHPKWADFFCSNDSLWLSNLLTYFLLSHCIVHNPGKGPILRVPKRTKRKQAQMWQKGLMWGMNFPNDKMLKQLPYAIWNRRCIRWNIIISVSKTKQYKTKKTSQENRLAHSMLAGKIILFSWLLDLCLLIVHPDT